MKREDLEALRAKVNCELVLERSGWQIDIRESTRRAVKYRRGSEIVIVTHQGQGWFDPLSDKKGDVFALVMLLDRVPFALSVDAIAALVGISLDRPTSVAKGRGNLTESLDARWQGRGVPAPGSGAWRYLRYARSIPVAIIRYAIQQDLLREGPFGSMWAAHIDTNGHVVGWEERGPDWRGFATGGSKVLFRMGDLSGIRLCVTEAAIDAMSLAALESLRENSLYLSTGGGWSPATDAALAAFASRPGGQIVAATDDNSQGEIYADRLRGIAEDAGCDWQRLRPPAEDWNEALQIQTRDRRQRHEGGQDMG